MKQILAILFITLSIAACKKTTPTTPVTNDFKPLDDRLPKESGEWNITDVSYDGVIVNPNNPNLSLPFNGTGQNISGFFKFQNTGIKYNAPKNYVYQKTPLSVFSADSGIRLS